jgi:hypothetical protein
MKELLNEFLSNILEVKVARKVGDVWKTTGGTWSAKSRERTESGFETEKKARAWLVRQTASNTTTKKEPTGTTPPKDADGSPSGISKTSIDGQPSTAPTSDTSTAQELVSIPDPDPSVERINATGENIEYRPNDIVAGIFESASAIPIGPGGEMAAVRQIIDDNGNTLDVNDEEQRKRAVEILDGRIQKFHDDGTLREICEILAQPDLPRNVRTRLNKWLGNLGEVCGLRDMLAAGHPSYLLQDSNAKNDIVSAIDCGNSHIKLVGLSTKSSRGKKAGRIDANALAYITDTVAGKVVQLKYGRGRKSGRSFKAENVATALFTMQKSMFRTLTRGTIEKSGSGKRSVVEPPDKSGWDESLLAQAIEKQKSGSGGQRILLQARKITPETIDELYLDENSPTYKKFLSDMTKIMDDKPDAAAALIQTLSFRLKGLIKQHTSQGKHFSLVDFNDWFTNEISNLIDTPHQETKSPSSLVFESDVMLASFDAEKGYVGMRLVTGQSMAEAVTTGYPNFSEMSTREKLQKVLGWAVNPRGLVSSTGQGHVDAQQRAKPPLKLLKPSDYKTIDKFVEAKCKEK